MLNRAPLAIPLGRGGLEKIRQSTTPHSVILTSLMAQTPVRALDVSRRVWVFITEPLKTSVATAETQLLRSDEGTARFHARVHEHLASRDFAYLLPVLALFDKLV